jgi:hypothetical protein
MSEVTNLQRAFWAETTLHDYSDNKSGPAYRLYDPPEDVLADLLCDLMHYAEIQEIDFPRCLATGAMHYEAEKEEEQHA